MPLVTVGELLAEAGSGAVAAFNAITLEQVWAFREAAEQERAGLVVQLSQNAIRYHGGPEVPVAAVLAAAKASSAPIAIQLDHIRDPDLALRAPQLGVTSVMFDASELDDARNIALTSEVTRALHRDGVWVEAELGEIGGKNGVHDPEARTDPEAAARYVEKTGVDSLAVAVGSSHAMATTGATLDVDLVRRIDQSVDVPLVLHGSSGVDDVQLVDSASAGIDKVNVGTRFNGIFARELRAKLADDAAVSDPRRYSERGRCAMRDEAMRLLRVLRSKPAYRRK